MPAQAVTRSTDRRTPTRVVVAVLTYRRPGDLAELLRALQVQRLEAGTGGAFQVGVLVVDNDPDTSGRAVCEANGMPGLRYVPEPRPGIAAARNRALDEAGDEDVLVFIDDDERPSDGWLRLMLNAFLVTGRVGVVGPVISTFAAPLEPWVQAGRFFDRRRLPTGTLVTVAATNNLLLDLPRVRASGVRFDEHFGLSGGSDTVFVRQLVRAAGPLVWCDEATVTDLVPAGRCSRRWVTRRAFRMGNSWSRTSLVLEHHLIGRLRFRLALTGAGSVRLIGGLARYLLGMATGDLGRRARGVRTLLRGAGMLLGTYGYTYVEYRRHPSPAVR
jgi:succinoglycan biosynthesis protein ExoM